MPYAQGPKLNPETAWRCNRDHLIALHPALPFFKKKSAYSHPFHLPPSAARHRNAAQMFQPSNCWSVCVIKTLSDAMSERAAGRTDERGTLKGRKKRKRGKGFRRVLQIPPWLKHCTVLQRALRAKNGSTWWKLRCNKNVPEQIFAHADLGRKVYLIVWGGGEGTTLSPTSTKVCAIQSGSGR